MTPRERFRRVMAYEAADRLPVLAFEPYEVPALERWRAEGLPPDQTPEAFLGMDRLARTPASFGPRPAFETRVLSEDAEGWVETDPMGATVRRRRDAPTMYYGYLDHPVKTREDWARYRERYLGDASHRLPADLDAMAAALNASPYPVGLEFFPLFFRGCFYLMGMERFLAAFYEAPDLVHAIFEDLARMALHVLRLVLPRVRLDFVSFAEDLAYKTGPHVSPRLYREFWLPYQVPILEEVRRAGVPVVSLYTSGNIEALLPLLMEHGFNATWPLERGAGMDPVALRRRFGRGLRLGGGIPKEALVAGPAAIDREIERLMPLITEGGYLPAIDDMVPPEVSLAHYRHTVEAIRAIRLRDESR